jgi:hypothetical protein
VCLISASCERQVREARRLCAATEARLQAQQGEASQAARLSGACKAGSAEGAEPQGRPASSSAAAGTHNLSYLRQVVERYILMDDGEETDALFQVLRVLLRMPCIRHACAPAICTEHDTLACPCHATGIAPAFLPAMHKYHSESLGMCVKLHWCTTGDRHLLAIRRRDRA